ncbi:hypothetical protein L9F63_010968, partial [Diploptera punctata]
IRKTSQYLHVSDVMGRILRNNIESAPRTEHHTVNMLGLIVRGLINLYHSTVLASLKKYSNS